MQSSSPPFSDFEWPDVSQDIHEIKELILGAFDTSQVSDQLIYFHAIISLWKIFSDIISLVQVHQENILKLHGHTNKMWFVLLMSVFTIYLVFSDNYPTLRIFLIGVQNSSKLGSQLAIGLFRHVPKGLHHRMLQNANNFMLRYVIFPFLIFHCHM